MKSQVKRLLQLILKRCSIRILAKFHPDIVAITGSVGKTSTKDAVYEVLKNRFDVRRNIGNLNNEIGVPLTIVGAKSAKNIFDIFRRTFFAGNYPEKLVLEMGADRVGDMKYLTSFIKPKIAVVTRVASSHLEYFGTLVGVAKEKGILVEALDKDGWAILNGDDENVRDMSERTRAQVVFYGTGKGCDLTASDIKMDFDGLDFKLSYKKESATVHMDIVGRHMVYSALAAAAVGLIYGMNLKEIAKNLEKYKSPKGRVALIKGICGSIIIDDTYNANPESTLGALDALSEMRGRKKIVVLGDMLELGEGSKKKHKDTVLEALGGKYDKIVVVGERMREAVNSLDKENQKRVLVFSNSVEAGEALKSILTKKDIVLVKGSQGMRMEKAVEAFMAKPSEAKSLLCRQSKEWKKK